MINITRIIKQPVILFFSAMMLGLIGYIIADTIIYNVYVSGDSMGALIQEGDYLLGIKSKLVHPHIKRGDIVSFRPPIEGCKDEYIKRIIGLPGEEIRIENAEVYVNGNLLNEPYLNISWTEYTGPYLFHVPDECYLMLGDDRNNSYDSRLWDNSYVPYENIMSKTFVVYRLFSKFQYLY